MRFSVRTSESTTSYLHSFKRSEADDTVVETKGATNKGRAAFAGNPVVKDDELELELEGKGGRLCGLNLEFI